MRRSFFTLLALLFGLTVFAQHEMGRYVPETDPVAAKKIEEWQKLKFGLLMHWGPYSQWGIVESWSICPEDEGWCERTKGNNPENYAEYVKEYELLKNSFNPVGFNPEKWAKALEALNHHPKVAQVLFFHSPVPAGEQLRKKALAAGLRKPERQVKIW